ncbi:antibiotic biosynthesis monooxygenase [Streptacidiphilus sp. ASG 303]|uniref:putative quinol monooxygenase n=1 Tax=Streptacidiphilus sp. ASG 303 TaxID=2896847 RepID=UPI001E2AB9BC|nr:antibiotic biosynthesis monooxygenase [Streptacidiphilus sp. ASG 303]MCD0484184.1 antibiotic biosynthesis monooxygenase [Streptacidiphilus sp. ASG 303]
MPEYGFFVEFEAKPGKEDDVARFLEEAKAIVDDEPGTLAWFAFRLGDSSFRIFDAFETEEERETHLQGGVRTAIEERGGELFAAPPTITPVGIIASKIPG